MTETKEKPTKRGLKIVAEVEKLNNEYDEKYRRAQKRLDDCKDNYARFDLFKEQGAINIEYHKKMNEISRKHKILLHKSLYSKTICPQLHD